MCLGEIVYYLNGNSMHVNSEHFKVSQTKKIENSNIDDHRRVRATHKCDSIV